MSFNYKVNLNDTVGYSSDAQLVGALNEALGDFSDHLAGAGTLVVQLNIDETPAGRAEASPTASIANGVTESGATLVQTSGVYALQKGEHVPGTTSDITVTVDPGYLPELHFGDGPVPNGHVDASSVFRHELAHGFGVSGFLQQDGQPSANGLYVTPYDTLIDRHDDGTAFFTGPTAEAVYGGPVPLTTVSTTQNFYHLANFSSDLLADDLMNGVSFGGRSFPITNLDLAILKDVGAPVTDLNGVDFHGVGHGTDPDIQAPSGNTGGAVQASLDWDAIGAAMSHYNEATGDWWNGSYDMLLAWDAGHAGSSGEAPLQAPIVEAQPDWDAIAAAVTQHYLETGVWA
ncbi:hypothetical protein JMJ55_06085 [Belnapia sp. T6]|uniref:Leishmanolysin n=1 Tax=Belnapia mucosa TaxID=2804532 RepID=A0ABS1UZK5_9PROT|nr:hypothetical protein [Belnapia mucosa]MBL6454884.1 hypothetical protein [Belnapia mucosa]